MILNNSTYQILGEIPLDMWPNIIFVLGIMLLIILGLLFGIKSTKSLLKALFHKYIIIVSILVILWAWIIYWVFGRYLTIFYSNTVIILTMIFSTSIVCFTAYKWTETDSFLKNMVEENFEKNSIFGAILGSVTGLLSFNICLGIIEFFKSLVLPLILEFLFLPMIYVIAVLKEYLLAYNLLPYLSSDYTVWDVFKTHTVNLSAIHRFNGQLKYKLSNGWDVALDCFKSEFKLYNNCIYMGDELIGRYEYGVEIPEISGVMSEAYTISKNIYYIVGDWEIENLGDDMAFVYFTYKNVNVKLFIKIEYAPMHIWSPLIEDICEFELL